VSVIDRSSVIPFYYQLRQILEGDLRRGDLGIGDRLPSESALCERYGVSRTVVRQALSDLESAGLITRIKGKGSFVAARKTPERLVQALTSLNEDVRARGQRLDTKVLRLEQEPASHYVADALGIAESAPIILLERLRLVDGEPWVLTTAYLLFELCSPILELEMERRSLYETLERELGLKLHRGRRAVEAAEAGSEIARYLGIAEGAPVLRLTGVTYLADGRPVEYFVATHRGDRSRFEVDLFRPPAGQASGHPPVVVAAMPDERTPLVDGQGRPG
jgi:GntR family transcriptional regulator